MTGCRVCSRVQATDPHESACPVGEVESLRARVEFLETVIRRAYPHRDTRLRVLHRVAAESGFAPGLEALPEVSLAERTAPGGAYS